MSPTCPISRVGTAAPQANRAAPSSLARSPPVGRGCDCWGAQGSPGQGSPWQGLTCSAWRWVRSWHSSCRRSCRSRLQHARMAQLGPERAPKETHWGLPGSPIPTHRCWARIRSTRMCKVRTSAFRSSRASDLPSNTSSPSVLHGRTGACPVLGTEGQRAARGSPWGCSPQQGPPVLPRAMLGGRWPGTRGRVAVGWLSLAVVTETVSKPLASAKERTGISTCLAGPSHPSRPLQALQGPCILPGSLALPHSMSAGTLGWGSLGLGTAEV